MRMMRSEITCLLTTTFNSNLANISYQKDTLFPQGNINIIMLVFNIKSISKSIMKSVVIVAGVERFKSYSGFLVVKETKFVINEVI